MLFRHLRNPSVSHSLSTHSIRAPLVPLHLRLSHYGGALPCPSIASMHACMQRIYHSYSQNKFEIKILILKSEFETNSNLDKQNQTKHMKDIITTTLHDCSVKIYRSSQYSSFEKALESKAVRIFEDTNGYTSTIDCLLNCKKTAELLDHGSSRHDIKAVIWVNGERIGECFLAEAEDMINSYLKSI